MLEKVKKMMNITGTAMDETIKLYINEVIAFAIDAGVNPEVIYSPDNVGVIARGVIDLYNLNSGAGSFSDVFMKRIIQLTMKDGD